jgi:hypothetical protein
MLMAHPAAPMVRARKMAEGGSLVVLLAILAVVASAAAQHIGDPLLQAIDEGMAWPAVINAVLVKSIWLLPTAYLILSLLDLREALSQCLFTAEAGASLRRAGYWALWALAAKIVIAPTIAGLFEPAPLGLVLHYETFDVGMVGFAVLLMLAGRVVETANGRNSEFA